MITALYADGGVILKNPSEFGGTYGWVAVESEFSLREKILPELGGVDSKAKYVKHGSGFVANANGIKITNNITEYISVVKALEAMDEGWSGVVYSDSLITLGRIFGTWRNKNLPASAIERKDIALKRLGKVTCQHLDGHPTKAHLALGIGKRGNPVSKWNVMCDQLCNEESKKVKIKLQLES